MKSKNYFFISLVVAGTIYPSGKPNDKIMIIHQGDTFAVQFLKNDASGIIAKVYMPPEETHIYSLDHNNQWTKNSNPVKGRHILTPLNEIIQLARQQLKTDQKN